MGPSALVQLHAVRDLAIEDGRAESKFSKPRVGTYVFQRQIKIAGHFSFDLNVVVSGYTKAGSAVGKSGGLIVQLRSVRCHP
jgi:hypothetical protein